MNIEIANKYCVYCNTDGHSDLTEEHFIPQLIGGSECPVIFACKECNSRLGSQTDTLLGHYPLLLLKRDSGDSDISFSLSGHSNVQATALLKSGLQLSGHVEVDIKAEERDNPFEFGKSITFYPNKQQEDGSIWITHKSGDRPSGLPPTISFLRQVDIESVSVAADHDKSDLAGPALIKALLGAIYWDAVNHAPEILPYFQSDLFETIRSLIEPSADLSPYFKRMHFFPELADAIETCPRTHLFIYTHNHGHFIAIWALYCCELLVLRIPTPDIQVATRGFTLRKCSVKHYDFKSLERFVAQAFEIDLNSDK